MTRVHHAVDGRCRPPAVVVTGGQRAPGDVSLALAGMGLLGGVDGCLWDDLEDPDPDVRTDPTP